MKKREPKDNSVEKRSLMYSQIFNYTMNQADTAGARNIEVSAAVESGGGKTISSKRNYYIGLVVVAIIIALCCGWSYAKDDIVEGINQFLLKQNGVEMQLAEPEAVELNVDAFLKEARVNYGSDSEKYYYQEYDVWNEVPLSDGVKAHAADSSALRFTRYELCVYPENSIGKVKIVVVDDDAGYFDNRQYTLYGTFKIVDYTEKDTEIADKGELATFVYESESGNKAYFIRNWFYGTYTVYFELDNIIFEMEIPASNKAVKNAKEIFEAVV